MNRNLGYQKFAQGDVTVPEITGIVCNMRFTMVCKKLKEKVSRNIIVA